ncbi:MAG: hypothetical protein HBSAPP03_24520 [Phycisphaerae bacterium]|nr:MAG: hypothetical protein HBSAPP03_24520 [Phycisphaerae bacterium]
MRLTSARAILVSLACAASPTFGQPTPTPTTAAAPTKAKAPAVYDEAADAKAQIDAALARAAKENRRVLIQWGANWCGWCVRLHALTSTDRDVKRTLQYEYDLVHVDVGRFDKHMDLAAKYGADLKGHGIPFLTILDGAGTPLANQETEAFELKPDQIKGEIAHDGAKVNAFLKQHQAAPREARAVLDEALAEAKKSGKRVFLHFGAPWCVWCHRLEAWMARPDVAAILAREFVDCKVDQDRTTGGKEMLAKYNPKPGGIPWFVFLSPDGSVLADSNDPDRGNVGFPAADHEIAHFERMLRGSTTSLTDAEIAALITSLKPDPASK